MVRIVDELVELDEFFSYLSSALPLNLLDTV